MFILWGLLGIVVIFIIALSMSSNIKAINLRTVGLAFLLQVLLALFVLYVPFGQYILATLSDGVTSAVDAGKEGLVFVFGPLADGSVGLVFVVAVLGVIVFFAALISLLYYIKVMPLLFNTIGYLLHKILGTSKAESLSSAANIFIGHTEAPFVIKPFLNHLTKSELFALMVGGMASVAGGTLAGYVSLGVDAKYLIAASFMSAPGGLLMAKIMLPETQQPINDLKKIEDYNEKEEESQKPINLLDAITRGALDGLMIATSVAAVLVAFVGIVTLADMLLGGIGSWFGFPEISFTKLLGYLFSPLAFVIGIPWNEAIKVGAFLGQKFIFNEFVAYISYIKELSSLSPKTQAMTVFALCGFANVSSIGILISGIGVLAKKQRKTIAQLALKAVIAGTLSNLMSATLAGIFLSL